MYVKRIFFKLKADKDEQNKFYPIRSIYTCLTWLNLKISWTKI
jgi:hypothetical protein